MPLKVGTKCNLLHLDFLGSIVVEGIVRVCKGSRSKLKPKLLALRGEGEQMVQVI